MNVGNKEGPLFCLAIGLKMNEDGEGGTVTALAMGADENVVRQNAIDRAKDVGIEEEWICVQTVPFLKPGGLWPKVELWLAEKDILAPDSTAIMKLASEQLVDTVDRWSEDIKKERETAVSRN